MRRQSAGRTLALALALVAALGVLVAPTGASQLETVRFTSFTVPRAVAQGIDLGFFEREGLVLDAATTQNSEQQLQELRDLQWGIASTNADNVLYWVEDHGADFFIFVLDEGTVTQQLFVRPEIRSFEDLRGQTLAVDSAHSGFATVLRRILLRNGLVIDRDYRFLPVGNTALRTAALVEGRAAGAMLNAASEATTAAGIYPLARGTDYAPVWPGTTLVTTRRWAADHPHLLLSFIRALIVTNAWLADVRNGDAAIASIMRSDRVDETRARRLHREAVEELAGPAVDAQVRTDVMQQVVDLRVEVGLLAAPAPPAAKYVNPHWYALALQGVAAQR